MTTSPPLNTAALTLHDFHQSRAARIVAEHADAPLRVLTGLLFDAATAARTAGDTTSDAMLVLLGRICSIVLQPSNRSAPLTQMAAWSDGTTSFDPDHLQRQELNLLAQLAGQVDHVPLRARRADLVWLRAKRHGQAYPLQAIDDYRSAPPDPATWYDFGHDVAYCHAELCLPENRDNLFCWEPFSFHGHTPSRRKKLAQNSSTKLSSFAGADQPVESNEEASSLIELCESGFERNVHTELFKRGYRGLPRLPVTGYRIDMVVEGADDRRRAIEFDGAGS